jgi:hypothetical protein
VRQQKTGTSLQIFIFPELQKVLDAHPIKHPTFLTTFLTDETGKPFRPASFSQWFKRKCAEAQGNRVKKCVTSR